MLGAGLNAEETKNKKISKSCYIGLWRRHSVMMSMMLVMMLWESIERTHTRSVVGWLLQATKAQREMRRNHTQEECCRRDQMAKE